MHNIKFYIKLTPNYDKIDCDECKSTIEVLTDVVVSVAIKDRVAKIVHKDCYKRSK